MTITYSNEVTWSLKTFADEEQLEIEVVKKIRNIGQESTIKESGFTNNDFFVNVGKPSHTQKKINKTYTRWYTNKRIPNGIQTKVYFRQRAY